MDRKNYTSKGLSTTLISSAIALLIAGNANAQDQVPAYIPAPNAQTYIQQIDQQLGNFPAPAPIAYAYDVNGQLVPIAPAPIAQPVSTVDIATLAPTPVQVIYQQQPAAFQQPLAVAPGYQPLAQVPTAPTYVAPNQVPVTQVLPDVNYSHYEQVKPSYHFKESKVPTNPVHIESSRTTTSIAAQPYPNVAPQPGFMFEIDRIDDLGEETLISRKIVDMTAELGDIHKAISLAKDQLENIRFSAETQAADYYAIVAAIQSRLQAGSTPGNPRLVNSWNIAQDRLERLSEDVNSLGVLAQQVSSQADFARFLLETTRATFGISGALEQDHADLEILEDDVTNTIVVINRLLNETTDDINRRTAYLRSERKNLQTLASGITNGELFGRSISNQYFRRVTDPLTSQGLQRLRNEGKKPLAIIRFNKEDVNYQQPIYSAINNTVRINPNAQFEIIAVAPNEGTSAELALAATKAKQTAEDVVRTLSNMGLPGGKMTVSAAKSSNAETTEVHIYVK